MRSRLFHQGAVILLRPLSDRDSRQILVEMG
jgi:hypothetical protein